MWQQKRELFPKHNLGSGSALYFRPMGGGKGTQLGGACHHWPSLPWSVSVSRFSPVCSFLCLKVFYSVSFCLYVCLLQPLSLSLSPSDGPLLFVSLSVCIPVSWFISLAPSLVDSILLSPSTCPFSSVPITIAYLPASQDRLSFQPHRLLILHCAWRGASSKRAERSGDMGFPGLNASFHILAPTRAKIPATLCPRLSLTPHQPW